MDFYDTPPTRPAPDGESSATTGEARPYLGVSFECCQVYARVYRNAAGDKYVGSCPRCARQVRFSVGDGGSGSRFWTVR
ncbi:MAG: hypothetical protein EXR76_08595 [Myxococcales bacterium]|nr:hypothetical protein [Myxococcales bacterium]